jgi:hypothetical protein
MHLGLYLYSDKLQKKKTTTITKWCQGWHDGLIMYPEGNKERKKENQKQKKVNKL